MLELNRKGLSIAVLVSVNALTAPSLYSAPLDSCSSQVVVGAANRPAQTSQLIHQALLKNVASASAPSDYLIQMSKEGMPNDQVQTLARQQLWDKVKSVEAASTNVARLPGPPVSQPAAPAATQMTLQEFLRKYQLEWAADFPVGKKDIDRFLEIQELLRLMLLSGDTSAEPRIFALAFHYQAFDSLITYASETGNHGLLRKIGEFSMVRFLIHSSDLKLSPFFEITGPDKISVDQMLFDFYDLLENQGKDEAALEVLYATGEFHSRWRLLNERFSGYQYVMKTDARPEYVQRLKNSLGRVSAGQDDKHFVVRLLAKSGDRRLQFQWAKTFFSWRQPVSPGEERGFSYDENLEAALTLGLISGQVAFTTQVVSAMIDNPNMGDRFYFRDLYYPELGYIHADVSQRVADFVRGLQDTHTSSANEDREGLLKHLDGMLTKSAKKYFAVTSYSANSENSELFDTTDNNPRADVERAMHGTQAASPAQRASWTQQGLNELHQQNRPIVAAEFFIKARDREALLQLYHRVMSGDRSLFTSSRLAIVCAMAIEAIDKERSASRTPASTTATCAKTQIERYRSALETISTYPRFMGRAWTHCSGGCVDVANLNFAALRRMGFQNLNVVLVDSSKSIYGAPAGPIWHMFIVDSKSCDEEIIIDPSFKQFFSNPLEMPGLDVFVGTRGDLEAYYQVANYPKATCEKIYGYGRGSRKFLSLIRTRKIVEEKEYWKACEDFLDSNLPTPASLEQSTLQETQSPAPQRL